METQEFCSVCGKVNSRQDALHVQAIAATCCNVRICKECDESSVKEPNLAKQYGKRTSKNHECETCGRAFTRADNLVTHIRSHTGERPFKCQSCGKYFTRRFLLNVHIRTHTGEKPYKCETCGKAFTQRSTLNAHLRTHTGEKPYNCETCGKSFARVSTLCRHKITHTHVKPYVCKKLTKPFESEKALKCDPNAPNTERSFRHDSSLIRHRRTMHAEERRSGLSSGETEPHNGHPCKTFTCCLCGGTFADTVQLITHLKTHPGGAP